MSKLNGALLCLIFFLVSTSLLSPELLVSGSPVREQSIDRPDPLSHFKSYNGGYDIRNKHYWTSLAFTGVHGYAISGGWLLCGVGFGIFMIVKHPSRSSSSITDQSDFHFMILLFLFFLFTILAIVAINFVLVTNRGSIERTKRLKDSILGVGKDARRTIRKVTKVMKEMQHLLLPYDPTLCLQLNLTTHQLRKESWTIHHFIQKDGHLINLAIQTLYIGHIVAVTGNLVILVLALVLVFLHWHPGIIIIIIFCWILTTLCWALTGFDFFLHNFAEDTCWALKDFEQNPHNNSLSSLLPCSNPSHSDALMHEIGFTVHSFITKLNSKITTLHKLLGYKESEYLLGVGKICDPFSGTPTYSYVPNKCPRDAIPIAELPNVLGRFTCYKEQLSRECRGDGRLLPKASYDMAWAYTNSVQFLLGVYPDLQRLAQCSFLKDMVSDVVSHQCRPFRVSMRSLWLSMLFLSCVMVVWVIAFCGLAKVCQARYVHSSSTLPNPT